MPADNIDNEKAKQAMLKIAKARLEAAAIYLVGSIKDNIGTPSRTVTFRQAKGTFYDGKEVIPGRVRKVLGARGSNRSKPGEFPHRDYGTLRQSITWTPPKETPDGIVVRVGTPIKYGKFLEYGTSRMRARPWLRRTLKEDQETIRQIIEHGERSTISVNG